MSKLLPARGRAHTDRELTITEVVATAVEFRCDRGPRVLVPLDYSILSSGDVVVFVYGTAEDGMSPGPLGVEIGDRPNGQRGGVWWSLLAGLVRPVMVVVADDRRVAV